MGVGIGVWVASGSPELQPTTNKTNVIIILDSNNRVRIQPPLCFTWTAHQCVYHSIPFLLTTSDEGHLSHARERPLPFLFLTQDMDDPDVYDGQGGRTPKPGGRLSRAGQAIPACLLYLCRNRAGRDDTVNDIKRRVGKLEDIAGADGRPVIVVNWEPPDERQAGANVIIVTWNDIEPPPTS